MIDDQLKWITSLLSSYNITYWIDSGTLLGIIREGSLLKEDNDIDISMWADDFEKVKRILANNKKYNIRLLSFKKRFFKIKLSGQNYKFKIDINFFRKEGNHSWCPQPHLKEQNPENLFIKYSFLLIKKLNSKWPYTIVFDNILWKYFYFMGVWWIPNIYFDNLKNIEGNLTIPQNYNDYLSFRYGNWKVKNSNWNFWRDDNAIKHNILQFVKIF